MSTTRRFHDAVLIQKGACNPSGIARSLVAAIDEASADPASTGTAAICADPAVRLITHQLAHVLRLSEYDFDLDAYGRDLRLCEARAATSAAQG